MPQIIPPSPVGQQFSSWAWSDWYEKVRRAINESGNIQWSQITNFTGSNLTQIATRSHQSLQNLLPGGAFYHAPAGGTTGQVLTKNSGTDGDFGWAAGGGGGGGTVTSVGLSMPVAFTVTGSPVTTSGTLTVAKTAPTVRTGGWTLTAADDGILSLHPASDVTGRTCTIPSNAGTPLPIGFTHEIDNDTGAGAITIAITSDTLIFDGTTSTGTRTLVGPGSAYLRKIDTTRWKIVGTNLT